MEDKDHGQLDLKKFESLVAVDCSEDRKEEYVETHDPFEPTQAIDPTCVLNS